MTGALAALVVALALVALLLLVLGMCRASALADRAALTPPPPATPRPLVPAPRAPAL